MYSVICSLQSIVCSNILLALRCNILIMLIRNYMNPDLLSKYATFAGRYSINNFLWSQVLFSIILMLFNTCVTHILWASLIIIISTNLVIKHYCNKYVFLIAPLKTQFLTMFGKSGLLAKLWVPGIWQKGIWFRNARPIFLLYTRVPLGDSLCL